MPKILTALLFILITTVVKAQTWEVGGGVGAAGYIGDLNVNNPVKPSGGFANIFVKRNFDRYIAAKLSYTYGQISGDDAKSSSQQFRDRNLNFTTPLKELSLMAEFNFMSYIPDAGKNLYTPYIYAGAGITAFAPRTTYNGKVVGLRQLRTEGQEDPYAKNAIVVPFGAGIKYNFSGKWTVAGDLGYRYTNTDYLDDVSGTYANKNQFGNNRTARALSDRSGEKTGNYLGMQGVQRGDYRPRDFYMFVGFTVSYTFVTQKCYY
ncbi:type IX secretion system protein PorG [Mucilaginibacter phyllosphaerae]